MTQNKPSKTHRLSLLPKLLFHRVKVQRGQRELEVGTQVLVDVDVGSRGHGNGCRYAGGTRFKSNMQNMAQMRQSAY